MIYKKIELNNQNKCAVCPECGNEDTDNRGDYCQICGLFIANICSNNDCAAPLEGNARYCPHCGNKSTFLIKGLLKSWDGKETQNNDEESLASNELPF